MRVVHYLALLVEDHGGALVGGESRPLRQSLVVWIAAARKRCPGAAHLGLQRVAVRTGAGHGFSFVDVLQNKRYLERVERFQLAVADRRLPGEVVLEHWRLLLRLSLGLG